MITTMNSEPSGAAAGPEPDMISPGNRVAEPTTREQVEQLLALPGSIGELRPLAGPLGSADSRQAREDLAGQQNELVTGTVTAIEQLVDQGWAVSTNIDPRCSVDAAALYANDQDSEAEEILCDTYEHHRCGWKASVRLPVLFHGTKLEAAAQARGALIANAWDRHLAADYASAIPVVLAQVDGVTVDVTGGKYFFNHPHDQDQFVNDETLATVSGKTLVRVREMFSARATRTAEGGLSRHGVVHGRFYGYDTRAYSVKCFMLLLAVIEWAGKHA